MNVYDQQIKYLDKLQEITKSKLSAGNILGKKALSYIQHYNNAPVDTVYAMLAKSVEMEKGQSEYAVTERFMKYSSLKYKQDKSHGEQIIEDYLNASIYIVEVLDKYHASIERSEKRYQEEGNPRDSLNAIGYGKMIDASRISKSNIDAYFINSGAASCEDLSKIYAPTLEANLPLSLQPRQRWVAVTATTRRVRLTRPSSSLIRLSSLRHLSPQRQSSATRLVSSTSA